MYWNSLVRQSTKHFVSCPATLLNRNWYNKWINNSVSKRQSYFWLGLFAFGTISFTLVQDYIRPNYTGQSELVKYLLGIAPNYFAGLGLSSFFVVMINQINRSSKKPSASVWLNSKAYISSILISVIGLSIWEFMQTYSRRGRFDWHDLVWTILGASIFYLIWFIINRQTMATKQWLIADQKLILYKRKRKRFRQEK